MNREEFDKVMTILADEYDPFIQKFGSRRLNVYGPGRATAIFKSLGHLTVERFSQVVMRAFESERQAPMAKDLYRVLEEIRVEEHQEKRRQDRKAFADFTKADPKAEKTEAARIDCMKSIKGLREGKQGA